VTNVIALFPSLCFFFKHKVLQRCNFLVRRTNKSLDCNQQTQIAIRQSLCPEENLGFKHEIQYSLPRLLFPTHLLPPLLRRLLSRSNKPSTALRVSSTSNLLMCWWTFSAPPQPLPTPRCFPRSVPIGSKIVQCNAITQMKAKILLVPVLST